MDSLKLIFQFSVLILWDHTYDDGYLDLSRISWCLSIIYILLLACDCLSLLWNYSTPEKYSTFSNFHSNDVRTDYRLANTDWYQNSWEASLLSSIGGKRNIFVYFLAILLFVILWRNLWCFLNIPHCNEIKNICWWASEEIKKNKR